MSLSFSPQEYRTLIELLFFGDWVVNSRTEEPTPETQRYAELFRKVKSHYQEMGCADVISEEDGEFYESVEFEDQMMPLVAEYDAEVFWEELIARLAQRDAVNDQGQARFEKLPEDKRIALMQAKEERWQDEFAKHGLDRLMASSPKQGGPQRKDRRSKPKPGNKSRDKSKPKRS